LNWRDKMAATPRTADAHWTVLMLILAWARQGGLTTYRPPERVERLYRGDRSEMIWSEADVGAFLAKAPETLRRAMMLALYTGQRQGDLLALTWTAYDGQVIRLRQSKGGVRVVIPVHTRLRATLDALPRVSTHILTNAQHRPWKQESFRKVWLDASRAAGIEGLHFHDLRGTAVTRLAEAGCTVPEIAALTGHSLKHASTIVERYMKRTDKLAEAAIFKLTAAWHPQGPSRRPSRRSSWSASWCCPT
jgi:integrase